MSRKIRICIASVCMAAACGNSPAEGSGSDEPLQAHGETANLVAQITLDNGPTVEFYEPVPGVLWVSQSGTHGQKPVELEGDPAHPESVIDLYRRLSPDQPVPEALTAAYERSEALAPNRVAATDRAEPTQPSSPAIGGGRPERVMSPSEAADRSSASLTAAEFSAGSFQGGYPFCPTSSEQGAWNWCLLDWWGGAWASDGGTDRAWATVAAEIGAVTFKVNTSDYGGGSWTVTPGSWRWWKSGWTRCGFNNYCDFNARFAVENAENSKFHFGGSFLHVD